MGAASSGTGRRKRVAGEAARARARAARNLVAIPIDSVADAAIAARTASIPPSMQCDVCDTPVAPDPANDEMVAKGLYVWSRGDERRYEEPPLCERCATVLGIAALSTWRRQEEEDE